MIKYIIRGVCVVGAGILSFLLWTAFHIPGFGDIDVANAVAQDVRTAYGQFLPRDQVDRTHQGKALYAHPGSGADPRLVIYEVTSPQDQARIVAAARASVHMQHAQGVTIQFYEHQNVTQYSGGGQRRGPEHLLGTAHVGQGA